MVVEYRYLGLPDRFLQDCPITEWRGGTFRDASKLAAARKVDTVNCNAQLRQGREFQAEQLRKFGGVTNKSGRSE